MAYYEPPTCAQCGRSSWSPNEWCVGHPHNAAFGPSKNFASDGINDWFETPQPEREPTWDQTWLQCAHVMAKRSDCHRAQVGAVIVAADQTVISMSYNGPPRGYPKKLGKDCRDWCPRAQGTDDPSPTYDDCPSVHAEANAIARADFSRMKGATIYVSTSCCKGCAKLLANAGIKRVVFQSEEGRDYRNPQETIDFLHECGIEVSEV